MRRSKAIVSLLLALSMTLGFSALAETSAPADLLVLGDSISTGYGLQNPSADSYGAKLAKALELPDGKYNNLAVDGATSADLLALLKQPSTSSLLAGHNTVVISIGGNDLIGKFFALAREALGLGPNASEAELQAAVADAEYAMIQIIAALIRNEDALAATADSFSVNLSDIVSAVKAANPSANVYIQTVYNPFGGIAELENILPSTDTIIRRMNAAVTNGAAAGEYTVVDVYSAFQGNEQRYINIDSFDIHPNAAGHALIYQRIYQAMPDSPPRSFRTGDDSIPGVIFILLGGSLLAVGGFVVVLLRKRREK